MARKLRASKHFVLQRQRLIQRKNQVDGDADPGSNSLKRNSSCGLENGGKGSGDDAESGGNRGFQMCQAEEEDDEDGIFSPVRIPGDRAAPANLCVESHSKIKKSISSTIWWRAAVKEQVNKSSVSCLWRFWRFSLLCAGGCCARVKWVITWPLGILLYCTVPNCVRPRWHRWFMATFVASTLWIGVFSYLMVWMVRTKLAPNARQRGTGSEKASGGF